MTIRRNMMMRQTIMISSRTCSSTTCPPTLGRSPQTMAERKIPVQKGFCASFFLFSKIFQQSCRKPLFKISYICGVVAAATSFKPRLDLENFWKAISLLHLDKFCWIWKCHLSHIFCSKSSPWFTLLLLQYFSTWLIIFSTPLWHLKISAVVFHPSFLKDAVLCIILAASELGVRSP